MAKLVINSYEEFASHLGEKLGESEWLQVDQDRINKFADATLDPQWIHVVVSIFESRVAPSSSITWKSRSSPVLSGFTLSTCEKRSACEISFGE